MKKIIILGVCCICVGVYAEDNTTSFSNANLSGYLASHADNVSVINTNDAVNEANQLNKQNSIAVAAQPQRTVIVEQRPEVVSNPDNDYDNYDGGYDEGGFYGYGGFYDNNSDSRYRSDHQNGRYFSHNQDGYSGMSNHGVMHDSHADFSSR